MELVYLEGVAPDDPHHLSRAMPRIEALAARHPASEVLLRVDWRPGQAYARTDAERMAYEAALRELRRLRQLGGRLILQPGNEPQLEGARDWRLVEGALRAFIAQCQQALPDARLASIPVATFHPRRLRATAGQSPEGSPWADLDHALLDAWKRIAGPPDVLSVHVYGNPRLSVADDRQTRHERGWRFGLNVAGTWAENHAALGLDHLPVWISGIQHGGARYGPAAPAGGQLSRGVAAGRGLLWWSKPCHKQRRCAGSWARRVAATGMTSRRRLTLSSSTT